LINLAISKKIALSSGSAYTENATGAPGDAPADV
jgi:hypothetical protein